MLEAISARDIAVSGLKAQRIRMTVIANNIANWDTTRTPGGGAFRRQLTIFRGDQIRPGASIEKLGVHVKSLIPDPSPLRPVFQPNHPDANQDGYVTYPNINLAIEQIDLLSALRAYDANIAVLVSDTRMKQAAMRIIE